VAALVDTNVLVYRYDARFPAKQKRAEALLRQGIGDNSVRVPHQAVVEFVAATTRLIGGRRILDLEEALREAEEMLHVFPVLYPDDALVREAVRGCAAYRLSWFDAHLWAYAERYGLAELWSEDFEHGRVYGGVRAVNPFLAGLP
jgi:predicted nucleic acid-binding protein